MHADLLTTFWLSLMSDIAPPTDVAAACAGHLSSVPMSRVDPVMARDSRVAEAARVLPFVWR
jgi:hypothetical protein